MNIQSCNHYKQQLNLAFRVKKGSDSWFSLFSITNTRRMRFISSLITRIKSGFCYWLDRPAPVVVCKTMLLLSYSSLSNEICAKMLSFFRIIQIWAKLDLHSIFWAIRSLYRCFIVAFQFVGKVQAIDNSSKVSHWSNFQLILPFDQCVNYDSFFHNSKLPSFWHDDIWKCTYFHLGIRGQGRVNCFLPGIWQNVASYTYKVDRT